MKICVFTRSTTKHFSSGGMETQLKNLIEGLADNHDITVITTSYPDSKEDNKYIEKKVKYIHLGGTTPGLRPLTKWEYLFYRLKFLRRGAKEGKENYFKLSCAVFENLHQKENFDLVLSQSTSAQGLLKSNIFRQDRSIKQVAIIHGTIKAEIRNRFKTNKTFYNWARFLLIDLPVWLWELQTTNKKFFERTDLVIAVSENLKRQFLSEYPNYANKTKVIYNGINSDLFKPVGDKNTKYKDFTLLYVGRIDREKGVDTAIEATNVMIKKGLEIKLMLVGSGIETHLKQFKNIVEQSDLEKDILFLGSRTNEETVEFYQKAHVFIFPTRRQEGHPMTISESLCAGLPVIAYKMGGLAELIEDSIDGYLIEPENLAEMVAKIEYLYKNRNTLNAMMLKAREIGLKKYSSISMVNKYEREIIRLIDK